MSFALSLVMLNGLAEVHAASVLVTPGRADADDADISSGDTVITALEADRSYECTLRQRRITSSSEFATFSLEGTNPDGDSISYIPSGNITPVVASPVGVSSLRSRISILPAISGIYTLGINAPVASIATVRCVETSLFGGFNTFYAGVPIVELSNTSDHILDSYITVSDFTGTVFVDKKQVTIRPGLRVDTVFSSIPANTIGNVTVIHNGPAGSIVGWLAEYDFNAGIGTLRRERQLTSRPALP